MTKLTLPDISERAIRIKAGRDQIDGDLTLPVGARGVIVFAHGSGSSRKSPRNRYVAQELNSAGHATLLLDLLTGTEEQIDALTAQVRFNIPLLAERLAYTVDWIGKQSETKWLPLGMFGASTGAAAALVAAAERPAAVTAIVSRGGRPDLAGDALAKVRAPTLLIVGSQDEVVLGLNREAMANLRCTAALEVVPGATHLFEEEGALETVARMARSWFERWMGG